MHKPAFIILLAMVAVACRQTGDGYCAWDGFALGTTYHISARMSDTTGMAADIDSLFEEAENSMSLYRENSLLSRINRNETDSADRHITYCIGLAGQISNISGGIYDVTVKPLTDAWGFAAEEASDKGPNIPYIMEFVGYRKVSLDGNRVVKADSRVEIDLNSIAKGYVSDLMGRMLAGRGASDFIVEVGGEIACSGVNSRGSGWIVGIDTPKEGNFIPGADIKATIAITDCGLATSGNYRRYRTDNSGRKIVHTIDPLTGFTKQSDILSATVMAENCATADGLATMFMAAGLEKSKEILAANPWIEAYFIFGGEDGSFGTFATASISDMITDKNVE